MVKLPPVRKRDNYSDIGSGDLVFALFWDRLLGEPGAMREDREMLIATKTLNTLLISFKHGKHDQRSHGRRTARRAAAQSTYQAARAGGATATEARRAASEVSGIYQRNQRIANIDRALEATKGMTQGQRDSLEAERRRLQGEVQGAYARIPASARNAPGVNEQLNAATNIRPDANTRGPGDARLQDYQGRLQASVRERDAIDRNLRTNQQDLDYINRRLATETLTPGGRKGLEKERARIEKDRRALERQQRSNDKLLTANEREVNRELARAKPPVAASAPPASTTRPDAPGDKAYQAVRAYEDKIRPQRFERALAVDGNGKVIIDKDGGQYNVSFSNAEISRVRNAGNVVMTHNHPRGWDVPASDPRRAGNSFSAADVELAANANVYEMRAVVAGGQYYVRRPPQGWDKAYWDNEIAPRYDRVNADTRQSFTRQIMDQLMTPEQAEARHQNTVWSKVFGELGLEYGYEEG